MHENLLQFFLCVKTRFVMFANIIGQTFKEDRHILFIYLRYRCRCKNMFCTHCQEHFDWNKTRWSGVSDSEYLENADGVEKIVLEALVVCMQTEFDCYQKALHFHSCARYEILK